MTEPRHAVFLSYASQDMQAARRIFEALHAAGIEVWMDQSELRGGDAWDQKIRREIQDCALFIPVISSNTTERHEGDRSKAFQSLEAAIHLHDPGLMQLKTEPLLDPLRQEPRFQSMLRELKLLDR